MSEKKQTLTEKYPILKVVLILILIIGLIFGSEELRVQALIKFLGVVMLVGGLYIIRKISFDYKVKKANTIKSEDCSDIKDELEKKNDITGIDYKGAMASHDGLKDILDSKYTKAVMGILIVAQAENKDVARDKYNSLIDYMLKDNTDKDELIKNVDIYNKTLIEAGILNEQQAKEILDKLSPQVKQVKQETEIVKESKQTAETKPVKKPVQKEVVKTQKKEIKKEATNNQTVQAKPIFCRFCGSKLNEDEIYCRKCGKKVS